MLLISSIWTIVYAFVPTSSEEVQKRGNSPANAQSINLSKTNGSQKDDESRIGIFTIKAGSYTDREYAESESKRLNKMGFNSYVEPVFWKGKPWYVLKVGEFSSREEAKKIQNKLREKAPGLKSYILPENDEPGKKAVNGNGALVGQKKTVSEKRKAAVKEPVKENAPSTNLKNESQRPFEKVTARKILPPESPKMKEDGAVFYSIQIGSHKNRNYAESNLQRLKQKGFKSYVQTIPLDGHNWYRVKIGDFPTRKKAKVVQKKLAKELPEIESYIVEENPELLGDQNKGDFFYAIQVGSHKNKQYAESDLKVLKKMGFNGYVQTVFHEGDTWHRVRLGEFITREEASTVKGLLAQTMPESNAYIVEGTKTEPEDHTVLESHVKSEDEL